MKSIFYHLLVLSMGLFLFSCTNSENKVDELIVIYEEDEELDDFEGFILTPYGINAMIYLPDETASIGASTDVEVLHDLNSFEWELKVGPNFHMIIEDWGDDSFQEYIKNVENQNIHTVEYLAKEENFIYYKATLKVKGSIENKNVGVNHETYHVAAQHTINGVNYVFKTNNDGHTKAVADYMAKSVKSVKEIEVKPAV